MRYLCTKVNIATDLARIFVKMYNPHFKSLLIRMLPFYNFFTIRYLYLFYLTNNKT